MIAHAYDYLCCTEPFCKWNMPSSDDVKFLVIKNPDRFAHYQMVNDVHHIAVSTRWVNRTDSLLVTLAHEMVHLHARSAGIRQRNAHGRAFHALADLVCQHHPEFDRLNF
jgi:hypothetical protein